MKAKYELLLRGSRKEIREKVAIFQQALRAIDNGMAGESSELVPHDWCPKCETPYNFDRGRKPSRCDICGEPT